MFGGNWALLTDIVTALVGGYLLLLVLRLLGRWVDIFNAIAGMCAVLLGLAFAGMTIPVLPEPAIVRPLVALLAVVLYAVGGWWLTSWLLTTRTLETPTHEYERRMEAAREYERQKTNTAQSSDRPSGEWATASPSAESDTESERTTASDPEPLTTDLNGIASARAGSSPDTVSEDEGTDESREDIAVASDDTIVFPADDLNTTADLVRYSMGHLGAVIRAPEVGVDTPLEAPREWEYEQLEGELVRIDRDESPFNSVAVIAAVIEELVCVDCDNRYDMSLVYQDVLDRDDIVGVWHGHSLETRWECDECGERTTVFYAEGEHEFRLAEPPFVFH